MAQVAKIDVAQAVADLKENVQEVIVHAKDLHYADPQAWKFDGETAEFLGGGNPEVSGKYGVKNLNKGVTYEVCYYMSMKNHPVEGPVKLTLELPIGPKQEKIETITVKPHESTAVSVGKFSNFFPRGDIKFTFSPVVTGLIWKGLLIEYVGIKPSQ